MPIHKGSQKIGDITYQNQSIAEGYYGDKLVFSKRSGGGMFFMRLHNTMHQDVTINNPSSFLGNKTGNPRLITAVVEDEFGNILQNVKGSGNTIVDFIIPDEQSCVFRITWEGGMFSLTGQSLTYLGNLVTSAGCKIYGNYDVPSYFLYDTFMNTWKYEQLPGDVFDISEWYPTRINDGFLERAWFYSTIVETPILDTSHWVVESIGERFMDSTFSSCTSLVSVTLPDTSNWTATTPEGFFCRTVFRYALNNSGATITLKGALYLGDIIPLSSNSMEMQNGFVANVKVDPILIAAYQNSASWSNIDDNKFISW